MSGQEVASGEAGLSLSTIVERFSAASDLDRALF